MDGWSETLMSTLMNIGRHQFSDLTHILAAESHYKQFRLCTLLRSPHRFARIFRRIETLPLHYKAMLIARILLRSLTRIIQVFEHDGVRSAGTNSVAGGGGINDFDAGLLLILLCQVNEYENPNSDVDHRKLTSPAEWRVKAREHFLQNVLSLSGIRVPGVVVFGSDIDGLMRFRRLLDAVSGDSGGKVIAAAPASAATVVSLPWVEIEGGGKQCVICREEMEEGKGGCLLPCSHLFHCWCIVRWLRRRNTCPSCRLELPTDNVFCEIERLCRVLIQKGKQGERFDRS